MDSIGGEIGAEGAMVYFVFVLRSNTSLMMLVFNRRFIMAQGPLVVYNVKMLPFDGWRCFFIED